MPVLSAGYAWLAAAVVCEVVGTTMLAKTEQFSRIGPTLTMVLMYGLAFYFLTHALKEMPVGVVYAIWSGLGTVLITLIGVVIFRQELDAAAFIGIALIAAGLVVMNVFSNASAH
ncbi:DMT family transporter [Hansschlegelia beijingensis]